ncbi:MAG: hypothetical protein NC117_10025 [Pseudoflavonifractor sp.]|nr:hypothetical protein [Pseudoflavonifractor sp.]
MQIINYRSSIDFILRLDDADGDPIGWPTFDWRARFWTSTNGPSVESSVIGGEAVNCYNDDGNIHITLDNHNLQPGILQITFDALLEDETYPDGDRRVSVPRPLDIKLIREAAPCPKSFDVRLMLPYVKIDMSDLTSAQIAELQRPAVEAANTANDAARKALEAGMGLVSTANTAMEVVGAAKRVVDTMAQSVEEVKQAEQDRDDAEKTRVTQEAARVKAEKQRVASETSRGTSETDRVTAEAKREGEEQKRADAEQTRATAEQTRAAEETKRGEAESQRAAAETDRSTAETKRESDVKAAIDELSTAKTQAEAATKAANDAAKSAGDAAAGATSAAGDATKAAEAANTAKGEADTAAKAASSAAGAASSAASDASKAAAEARAAIPNINAELAKKVDTATYEAGQKAQDEQIGLLSSELGLAMGAAMGRYYVAAYDESLAPEPQFTRGDRSLVRDMHVWLIDVTQGVQEDGTIQPWLELNRRNWLRTVDDGFAPTIGITEAQRAECDVALYLDAEATQLYCEAGAFDAEAFYNEHKMAKLYNADGAEVRVLRPWESTSTSLTIGISFGDKIYLLDQIKGESGNIWKGLFNKPITWDGIDVSQYELPPTAYSPGPYTTRGGAARCLYYDYEGETNCKSMAGIGSAMHMFDNGRTYPRCTDVSQISSMAHCRANNPDNTKPYPCAEGGYHALNSIITAMELAYGTKAIHSNAIFGSGISSNDTCNSEATWLANGGFRYRFGADEAWKYTNYATTIQGIAYNTSGNTSYVHNWISYEAPKEQCLESQMARSMAEELGVAPGEKFEFYGSEYWYQDIPGSDGALMDAKVYKIMTGTAHGYSTADGSAMDMEVEVCLRMSVMGGFALSGDDFVYSGGGYELVGLNDRDNTNDRYGFPVKLYTQPDQRKWHADKTVTIEGDKMFGFESSYRYEGESMTTVNSCIRHRISNTPFGDTTGGGLLTGECYYAYMYNAWGSAATVGKRTRIGSRFRGSAYYARCSPRNVICYHAVSYAHRIFLGSAQFVIMLGASSRRLPAG